jgi:general secretion pathway protein G
MQSHAKRGQRYCQSGITLLELMIVLAVLATLAGIATASYQSYKLTSQNEAAKKDILQIATAIERYHLANNAWPSNLAAVNLANKLDPWGNNYIYARIPSLFGSINISKTQIRQDANLRPINTFYDLYSMGADGDTTNNISVPVSRDDIIRARDGDYIGLARDY